MPWSRMGYFIMLNEFYSILRSLKAVGAPPTVKHPKHPKIQEPGVNNTTFRVTLGPDGTVESVGLMDREKIENCWSWGSNQDQFPAVKIKKPLVFPAPDAYVQWKNGHPNPTPGDWQAFDGDCRKLLGSPDMPQPLSPIEHIDSWPGQGHRNSISRRMELLERHESCKDIYELFARFCKHKTGVEILVQVRDMLIKDGHAGNNTDYKEICALLFGEKLKSGKDNGEVEDKLRVTLLLDCLPDENVRTYASSKDHELTLSAALHEEDKAQGSTKTGTCAISGASGPLVLDTFPKRKLKVVGPTIIFAKSTTSGPTVKRYGKSEADAFALSRQLSYELSAAVAFLCEDRHKDQTWSQLPNSNLLLAFCHEKPNAAVTPLVTGILHSSEIEDMPDYRDASASVINAFRGHATKPDHKVDFVEIIKVNDGNRKVNFKATMRVGDLLAAAQNWEDACINAPEFRLYSTLPDNKAGWCDPYPISPMEAMRLSMRKHIRGGDESRKVVGINFAETMKLFHGGHAQPLVGRVLRNIAEQYEPLAQKCALSKTQGVLTGKARRVKVPAKKNAEALKAATFLSILLFKSGRSREDYMQDLSFQLGQLCSAMDELHIGYCVSERSGDIPSTLLGNQAYGMALHSPVKALAFMADRRKPYDSWVKRYKAENAGRETKDKPIRAALGASRWIAEHAAALASLIRNAEMGESDTHKAELMLGYLAGRPFPAKGNPSDTATNTGDSS